MTKKGAAWDVDKNDMWTTEDQARIFALMPKAWVLIKTKWRPAVTESVWVAIETALKLDCSVREACNIAGISKAAYYNHLKANPEMEQRMKRAMDYPKILARAAVQHAISRWDGKLAMKYLELRDWRFRGEEFDDDELQEKETKQPLVWFTIVQWHQPKKVEAPDLIEGKIDSQNDTEQKSASEWYVILWERQKSATERKSEEKIEKYQEKIRQEQEKVDAEVAKKERPVRYEDPETLARLGLLSSNNESEAK